MRNFTFIVLALIFSVFSAFSQKTFRTPIETQDGKVIMPDENPSSIVNFKDEILLQKNYSKKSVKEKSAILKTNADFISQEKVKSFENEIPDLTKLKTSTIEKLKNSKAAKSDATFVTEADSLVLVALYNSTNGSSWTDNTNWLTGPVNSWHGITVYYGEVTSIELEQNNLSGPIPNELVNITSLEQLWLYENNINGSIPSEIGNLSNILYLSLWGNQITGIIPASLGNLSYLNMLDLSDNKLTGSIPSEIGNLSALDFLSFFSNQLSGSIPSEIGNLTNLEYLYLFDNQLSGQIPTEIGNLINLHQLYFYLNQLSGQIPHELGNLIQLEWLYIDNNQLSGNIPVELSSLSNLIGLGLNSNLLSGSIPVEFGNLSNLQYLYLNSNQLSGSIPAELGNLSNLQKLNLSSNQLTGSIPTEIGDLINLTVLELYNNELNNIPDISYLVNLSAFSLHNNYFTFEDFENSQLDFSTLSTVTYSPQADLEIINPVEYISEGNNFTISCDNFTNEVLSSTTNQYAVYKDGALISNWSTNPDYTISSFNSSEVGEYAFQVKNTSFPDLILYSDTLTLEINNAPTNISLSNTLVNENVSIGSVIGQLSTTDADNFDSHTYTFATGNGTNDVDNASFIIDGNDLKTATTIDFETKSAYYIYIQTEDGDGLTYSKAFTISVVNINEAPTNIELTTSSIDENSAIASVIGQFSTTDVDTDDSHIYTFATGNGTNDADNSSFTIDGNNLKTAIDLDFETKQEYFININTEDAGRLSFSKAFVITINDVTETGINDINGNQVLIYPNPSKENVTVEFNSNNYKVKIIDAVGNVVYENISKTNKHLINLNNLASGLYFVLIEESNNTLTKKLIVK